MNNSKFLVTGVMTILMSITINPFGISFVFSENDSNYLLQAVNNTIIMTEPNANHTYIMLNTNLEDSDSIPNGNITVVEKIDPTLIGGNETIYIINAAAERGDFMTTFTVPPINELRSSCCYLMDPVYSMAEKIDGLGLCKSNFPALEVYCQTLAPLT